MISKIVNFIFEMLHLKAIKHEWWRLAWVESPDSVAEHSLNAAQIWYLLAKMEWVDAEKVCAMLVRHDMAETRIGDITKVGARYRSSKKEIEKLAFEAQIAELSFAQSLRELEEEMSARATKEALVAKDADYLEMAFQAKKYTEHGYGMAEDWIVNVGKSLKTESAKQLRNEMIKSKSTDRWSTTHLKKLPTS